MENSVTLQTVFYRVLKTKIRTKSEHGNRKKNGGFLIWYIPGVPRLSHSLMSAGALVTTTMGTPTAAATGSDGRSHYC